MDSNRKDIHNDARKDNHKDNHTHKDNRIHIHKDNHKGQTRDFPHWHPRLAS
jgi:hypothetical protein